MKRNLILLSILLISAVLLTPASGARQEHVRLVLKNAKHTFTATLNPAGYFVFSGVKPGTYHVREVVQTGYKLTAPKSGINTVVVKDGVTSSANNFGDKK